MNRFFGMGYNDIMEILLEESEIADFDPENADVFNPAVDAMVDEAQQGTIEMAPRVWSDGTADITDPIAAWDVSNPKLVLVYPQGETTNAVYWIDIDVYDENPEKWVLYDEDAAQEAREAAEDEE